MTVANFDINSAEFARDPFPTFAKMREAGPVFRMKMPFVGEAWTTSTYDAAIGVLRDKDAFVSEPKNAGKKRIAGFSWWMPRMIRVLTQNMVQKDEPDHRRLRSLVESAFLRQSVDGMRPRIAELAERQLNIFQQSAEKDGQADFVEQFARPFPLAVICELLGLPDEDRPKFIRWASAMTTASSAFGLLKGLPGLWKLTRYFSKKFDELRENPQPGMLSALVAAEQEGDKLSKDELLASAFVLLFAGHETTVHLLSNAVRLLLQHPGQKSKLLNNWKLAETTVDEVLRHASPVQLTKPRYVAQDIEFHGQALKRGDVVMPSLAAANCDPAKFDNPEQFDITRDPNPHLGFGTGIHVCLGLKLAKAECEIALERLFTRYPVLAFGVPESELVWNERIGTRALRQLPLRLGTKTISANAA